VTPFLVAYFVAGAVAAVYKAWRMRARLRDPSTRAAIEQKVGETNAAHGSPLTSHGATLFLAFGFVAGTVLCFAFWPALIAFDVYSAITRERQS